MLRTIFTTTPLSTRASKKRMKLEQIFGTKLLIQFLIVFILLFLFISFYNLNEKRVIELRTQKMILEDLIHQYDAAQVGLNNNIELFEKDYLNRAWAVEFILNTMNSESITHDVLTQITKLMQVNTIHLVSDDGVIILSSDDNTLGLNLRTNEKSSAFWGLIDGTSVEDEVVLIGVDSILLDDKRVYIGIKSELPGISMIQLDIPISVYQQAIEAFTVKTLIEKIPTEYAIAIFAVDSNTGELIAITKNNAQKVVFEEGETSVEFLEHLKNYTGQFRVRINDTQKHLTVIESGDYIFGTWTDVSRTYENAINETLLMALALLVILSLIYSSIRILVKKYLINDIEKLNKTTENLLAGDMTVTFPEADSQELIYLCHLLNKWRNSYIHKSDRMTKMIEKIDPNVAIFECLHTIDKVFFSSNIITLLDIKEEQLKQITSHCENFEQFISSLKSKEDKLKYIRVGKRYVSINLLGDGQEFYGVIIDKTHDMAQLLKTKSKLEKALDKIKRDPLTGLYNRKGMTEELSITLANNPNSGLMMIFDLDNFKKINDNAGHPEGDKALKIFADCLRHNFQTGDIIARMGGDEFAVFIPKTLSDDLVKSKCDMLLKQIRISLKEYYEKYNVSASIGIAFVSEETATYEKLYLIADAALYIAKECGKNTYFLNKSNIKCIRNECIECTKDCERRKVIIEAYKKRFKNS